MRTIASMLRGLCLSAAIIGAASALAQPALPQSATASASTGISVSTINGQSVVSLNGKEIFSGHTTGQVTSRSSNINGVEYNAVYDGDKLLWENVPGAGQQLQSQGGGMAGLDHQQFAAQHREAFERMVAAQRQFMESHAGMAFGTNRVMTGGSSHSSSSGSASTGNSTQNQGGGSTVSGSAGLLQPMNAPAVAGNPRRQSGGIGSAGAYQQPLPPASAQTESPAISIKTVNGSTVIVYQGKEFSVGPTKGRLSAKTKSAAGEDYTAAFEGDRVIWENVPGAAQQVK